MAESPSAQDKAVQKIVTTIAASRFTKTPIDIEDVGRKIENLMKQFKGLSPDRQEELKQGMGSYDLAKRKIRIQLSPNSDYGDFSNILHHEDIHALLDKEGQITAVDNMTNGTPLWDAIKKGNRGGYPPMEFPAYMGAYSPTQMPGLSQSDRDNYQQMLQQALSKHAFDQYTRIVNSYKASQQPQSQMAPNF